MEHWFQSTFTPAAYPFFNVVSDLGTGAPMTIGLLLVFLIFGTKTGIRAGLLFLAGSYLTYVLKVLIAAPRPYFVDDKIIAHSLSSGYGMPSGHATHTAAAMSPLVRDAKLPLVKIVVVIFIVLVCLSRVYLGVHYFSQVLVGLILGVSLFLLFEFIGEKVVVKLRALSKPAQALMLATPFIVLFATDHIGLSTFSPDIPPTWQANYDRAIDARAQELGIALTDSRVQERKDEFSLVEPRSGEFYAIFAGWLIVCFIFLQRIGFSVNGLKHMGANVVLGGGFIGVLYAASYIVFPIVPLQYAVLVIAPVIVGYVIPRFTDKWFGNHT